MNSADPLPSLAHIIQTRWRGGRLGRLPIFVDERSQKGDHLYLARIRNTSEVEVLLKSMLDELANVHVDKDILLSGIDAPRHFLYATYSGGQAIDTARQPQMSTEGIIATLGERLVFCFREKTFSLVDGMCFWGWIGMKDRVAWKVRNGILEDTCGRSALPHDAGEEASECWKRIATYWAAQNASLEPSQKGTPQGVPFSRLKPVPISAEVMFWTWTLFKSANL